MNLNFSINFTQNLAHLFIHFSSHLLALCTISLSSSSVYAQAKNAKTFQTNVINRPSNSLRCRELGKKRKQTTAHKQKLQSLISRNKRLIDILNKKKNKDQNEIMPKLKKTAMKLKYELKLAVQKISNAEESLVKTGCPNLSF